MTQFSVDGSSDDLTPHKRVQILDPNTATHILTHLVGCLLSLTGKYRVSLLAMVQTHEMFLIVDWLLDKISVLSGTANKWKIQCKSSCTYLA